MIAAMGILVPSDVNVKLSVTMQHIEREALDSISTFQIPIEMQDNLPEAIL